MKPKDNDWKSRLGMVYSTNPDYVFNTADDEEEAATLPPQQQRLRVQLDRRNRGGKVVTLVSGFVGTEEDLKALGKMLKTRCGVGGAVKDGVAIVQGDRREQIVELLRKEGYSQTK